MTLESSSRIPCVCSKSTIYVHMIYLYVYVCVCVCVFIVCMYEFSRVLEYVLVRSSKFNMYVCIVCVYL